MAGNDLGLHDLCGNVREWASSQGQGEHLGYVAGCGGAFTDLADDVAAAPISWHPPRTSGGTIGIRPARDLVY